MAKLPRPAGFEDPKHLPPNEILIEIGRLAVVSGGIEDILHAIYWKLAGVSPAVGAVMTGDARPNRLMEDIIKIAESAKIDGKIVDDLKDIFADYKPLATKRNQCIHWTWNEEENGKFKVEAPTYKLKAEPVFFTLVEVKTLADDLVWIETRLDIHAMSEDELRKAKEEPHPELYAPTPWLDKPQEPNPKPFPRPDRS